MFRELAQSDPRAAAEAALRRWHRGCGGGGPAVAAAGTTSAFLTVGVTGAGSGHSPISPGLEPARNPGASGIFSQLSLRFCPETRWLVTPTRGFLGEREGSTLPCVLQHWATLAARSGTAPRKDNTRPCGHQRLVQQGHPGHITSSCPQDHNQPHCRPCPERITFSPG